MDEPPVPPSDPSAAPAPAPAPAPVRRRRRWPWVIAGALALVLLVAGSGLWWVLRQERGTAFLLSRLPGVEVVRPRGTLWGDFGADEVRVRFGDGGQLRLVRVAWTALSVSPRTAGPAWATVSFDRLAADEAWLTLPKAKETTRTPPPTQLTLPVELIVRRLQLGALHAAPLGDVPVRDLSAAIHLGADRGRLHRVDDLSVARGPLQASGFAHITATAPMPSDVQLQLRQSATGGFPGWQAGLQLQGPLAQAGLRGRLQTATQPAQTLTLDAVVRPFAEWPLGRLDARAQGLDVSALLAGGPRTALDGEVVLAEANAEQPLQARVSLRNGAAGAWDAGRLPVRSLALQLQADRQDPRRLQLPSLQAELGDAQGPAGRLEAQGRWAPEGWTVQALLQDLSPQRLHGASAAMRAGGRFTVNGVGFGGGGVGPAPTRRAVNLDGELQARLAAAPAAPPLSLSLQAGYEDAGGGRQTVQLRRLHAEAGRGRADVDGTLQREAADRPWALQAALAVHELDLQPWVPGDPRSALKRLPSRLSAEGRARMTVPAAGPGEDLLAWLARLQGEAALQLQPSVLAGLPLQGRVALDGDGGTRGLQATVALQAAGNRVEADGRLAGRPADDRWRARIDAPSLERLAPLIAVATPPGGRAPAVAGRLQGELDLDGRWPRVRSQGSLQAASLVWPGVRLREAQGRWQLGTAPGAPMTARVTMKDLLLGTGEQVRQVPALSLALDGTAQRHRLALDTQVAAAPPAWADPARSPAPAGGPATGPRTALRLRAEGALTLAGDDLRSAAGWQGRIEELDAREPGARSALLHAAGLRLALQGATASRPAAARLEPGRVELLGGALRWSRLSWQGAQGRAPAAVDADVVLEPLQVVPLLARLQPDAGFAGDLVVGGRLLLRTAPTLRADLRLQRERGDLAVRTAERAFALGLSELRLAVLGEAGRWNAQARVAGRAVGQVDAGVVTRAVGDSPWPSAESPLEGTLRLQVAELGLYDPWLPVGWRVDGQLQADARLGGRLGAPEVRGRLTGQRLAVSNFLQGVRVRDGELAATLDGERARIERFVARAGDGVLRIEGGAELGAKPTALLNVTAERFRALGRVDRLVDVSGGAQVRLDAQRLAVNGRFKVDRGLVDLGRSDAPQLGEDVVVVDDAEALKRAAKAKAEPAAPARAMDLDLRVSLGDDLRVRGRGVNTRVTGDLRVTAPAGQLALDGSVRTVDGTYDAYGTELAIDRGVVTFVGPPANPRLDVVAMRRDLGEVQVGVSIGGTAQNPRVALVSTPALSDMDKLSYLTIGRPSASLATDQTALLQRAAMGLWASQRGSSGGEGGIAKRVGLDALSVKRGESGGLSDAVVSLGKQVSERLYVGYQQSLDATGGSWELIYKIAQRLTVRVQTGDTTALDVVWTWLWG